MRPFSTKSSSTLKGSVLGALLLTLVMFLSGCGAGTTTGSTPTATTATGGNSNCSVATTDLGPGGDTKATAPNDGAAAAGTITIDGSSALQPLVTRARDEYVAVNAGANITVNAGGSGKGLTDVEAGAVQIGNSDLFTANSATPDGFKDLTDHQVAAVIFAIIVNPDVTVNNLTTAQIRAIFTGAISNWSQVGGPNEPITAIERPAGSGTRGTFSKYVMNGLTSAPAQTLQKDDSGALGDTVAMTPGAIGYIATSFVGANGKYNGKVKTLCIDGYKPGPTDVSSNNYKFWNFEHMYTKGAASGLADTFIKFILSDAFQKADVPSLYFLSVSSLSDAAKQSHQP
jgi:phosphate transport system substrate-binding protein